jgi:hypothetical protein
VNIVKRCSHFLLPVIGPGTRFHFGSDTEMQ